MATAMREPIRLAFSKAKRYDNPGLGFERCLPESGEKAHESSQALLEAVSGSSAPDAYKVAFSRWASLAQASGMVLVSMELTGPLVVGIGNDTGMEVGITTNRTYGMPVIPGSAVKGLCHRTAELVAGLDPVVLKALFGDTEHAACCTWHDAWYDPLSANGTPFQADTITVHHPEYYQSAGSRAWPTDFDDPTPVAFLSVRAGCRFAFAIEMHAEEGVKEGWDSLARDFLIWCLGHRGIGAKTNAGYGRFKPVEEVSAAVSPPSANGSAAGGAAPTPKKSAPEKPAKPQPVAQPRYALGQRLQAKVVDSTTVELEDGTRIKGVAGLFGKEVGVSYPFRVQEIGGDGKVRKVKL